MRPPPRAPLFPYTTLFRSCVGRPAPPRRRESGRSRDSGPARARSPRRTPYTARSEEHTSELQSLRQLVCRLLLEKKEEHSLHRMHTSSNMPSSSSREPHL